MSKVRKLSKETLQKRRAARETREQHKKWKEQNAHECKQIEHLNRVCALQDDLERAPKDRQDALRIELYEMVLKLIATKKYDVPSGLAHRVLKGRWHTKLDSWERQFRRYARKPYRRPYGTGFAR